MNAVGPAGAAIHAVSGHDSPYLQTAVRLFRELFPEYERYVPFLEACAECRSPRYPATHNHLWVLERGNAAIGLRVFCYLPRRDLGYGIFIGVLPPYRSLGLGAWLVRQTIDQLASDAKVYRRPEPLGYCAEVERVGDAESAADRLTRQRRLAFHIRNGALLLPVDYLEPPMPPGENTVASTSGHQPRPMHLVFYPTADREHLTRGELLDVLGGLYFDVYQVPADTSYLQQVLNSVSERGASC